MKRLNLAGVALVALLTTGFGLMPVAAAASTSGNTVVYPVFEGANKTSTWNAFGGKGTTCIKTNESGGFQTVRTIDMVVVNYPDRVEVTRQAPKDWYGDPTALRHFRCDTSIPSAPPPYYDARATWVGPCGNQYRVLLNVNALSNRPVTYTIRRVKPNGDPVKKTVTVPVGKQHWTDWLGTAAGTNLRTTSPTTGETLFSLPTAQGSC